MLKSKSERYAAAQSLAVVPMFEPVFTEDQVKDLESHYEKTWGVARRVTQIVLARSSRQLIDGFASTDKDGEVLFDTIDQLVAYKKHLQAAVDLAETAMARLIMVGQHFVDLEKESHDQMEVRHV